MSFRATPVEFVFGTATRCPICGSRVAETMEVTDEHLGMTVGDLVDCLLASFSRVVERHVAGHKN